MLDVVIHGGKVVTQEAVGLWDVAIRGEQIVAITTPDTLTTDVAKVIDASGRLVIPGGIDPHVHTGWPQLPGGKVYPSAPPGKVSQAALFGGTTTLVDFAMWEPGISLAEAIERKEGAWQGAWTDYALHVSLKGVVPPNVLGEIPEVISAGFPSFKVFTTDIIPARRGLKVEMVQICAVIEQLAKHGGILAAHAEDDDVVMYMYDRLQREGRVGCEHLALVHSPTSEDLAFRRIIGFARRTDGAAIYFVHVSAQTGVDAIAEARAEGYPIYGETLHNYLCFTADVYRQPDGVMCHTFPGLKYENDQQRLWTGISDGSLSAVATDEVCTPREVKLSGKTIFDAVGGHVGVETRLPIVYTEGVSKRGLPLERFVAVTSTNAAKILGLYPQKGVIAPGSDADIVVLDHTVRKTIRAEELHGSDYSIWDGWEVHGWPVVTMVRGRVVVENGELREQAGGGRRVRGRLLPEIQSGRAKL